MKRERIAGTQSSLFDELPNGQTGANWLDNPDCFDNPRSREVTAHALSGQ